MAVVWSAISNDGFVTISGAGLIATGSTGGRLDNGRSDTFISGTDKVHWEVIHTSNAATQGSVGFANVTWDYTLDNFMGFVSGSLGYYDNGQVFTGSSLLATISPFSEGDVIAFEVDFGLGKYWAAVNASGWNNDILANQNPATGTGGIPLTVTGNIAPSYSLRPNGGSPGVATGRFLAASFTRAISSGFTALDATAASFTGTLTVTEAADSLAATGTFLGSAATVAARGGPAIDSNAGPFHGRDRKIDPYFATRMAADRREREEEDDEEAAVMLLTH